MKAWLEVMLLPGRKRHILASTEDGIHYVKVATLEDNEWEKFFEKGFDGKGKLMEMENGGWGIEIETFDSRVSVNIWTSVYAIQVRRKNMDDAIDDAYEIWTFLKGMVYNE